MRMRDVVHVAKLGNGTASIVFWKNLNIGGNMEHIEAKWRITLKPMLSNRSGLKVGLDTLS
jgi:hypothetical protein